MSPEHVASLVVYLLSPLAADVNGEVLGIAGARTYAFRTRETAGAFSEGGAPDPRWYAERFRDAMELNVTAVWHLSKLVGPSMIANKGGSIINVASMLGLVGASPVKQAHYCASKGAVVNLTREMAAQWGRKGVRVNSLCPGWFESEMTAGMESDETSLKFIATMSPIPRMGFAHELDTALLMLAAPGNTFMTGQSVVVDGGWTAR